RIRSAIHGAGANVPAPPVMATVATTGLGVPELLETCLQTGGRGSQPPLSSCAARSAIEAALADELFRGFSAVLDPERWRDAIAAVCNGAPATAAAVNLLANATISEW